MDEIGLFDEARCAACGQTIEGDPHPLTIRHRTVYLCALCAEDPLPASYVARKRAKAIIGDALRILDVAERLEELQGKRI